MSCSFPETVWGVFKISEVGEHHAILGVVAIGLREPGPALTTGVVLEIFKTSLLRWIINLVFDTHTAESPALFIVRDRSEDIQDGGVSPALVNLENKEISSVDIIMLPLSAHTL